VPCEEREAGMLQSEDKGILADLVMTGFKITENKPCCSKNF
jgi:hypothetical protein